MTDLIKENIYGHGKRLRWIISHIRKKEVIVELGCGTGSMITLPLRRLNYVIYGLDLDKDSVSLGKEIFRKEGLDPQCIKGMDLVHLDIVPDVIIASEVLEHMPETSLRNALDAIQMKLKPGGKLLVTVPNGYGWFELESFLWFKTGIGDLLQRLKIGGLLHRMKCLFLGNDIEPPYPSTLSNSRHRQRFTYSSIQELLRNSGFEVSEVKGSVLVAGPFSNLLFTGVKPLMRLNCKLGRWFPRIGSGFYIACKLSKKKWET